MAIVQVLTLVALSIAIGMECAAVRLMREQKRLYQEVLKSEAVLQTAYDRMRESYDRNTEQNKKVLDFLQGKPEPPTGPEARN